jgi:hypothetical protein
MLTVKLVVICLGLTLSAAAAPPAVQGNQVLCGPARFDMLAPDLVRMQFTTGAFVDAPTAVVTDRGLRSQDFEAVARDGWLYLTTDCLRLRYRLDSGRFTSDNLRVDWTGARGHQEWTPGVTDEENLGGPVSSFNAIIEETRPERTLPPFPPGFLSRAGYCLLDDSRTPVWNAQTQWIEPRADREAQDLYLFVYGTDFATFLQRYTQLAGRVPMIPRYALGAWVTDLNFEYSSQKVDEGYLFGIVDRFRQEQIPLDVFVLDFGWHPYGWGGSLDWSPFIPQPEAFLAKMRQAGIRVSANDHPSSGLDPRDSRVPSARRELGLPEPADLPLVDLTKGWVMREDTHDAGFAAGWQGADLDDADWRQVPDAGPWEDLGLPGYDGNVWYRQWAELREDFSGKNVYLSFGGVDDEYDLYINGKFVRHWGAMGASVYDKRTVTDITPFVTVPGRNLIALKVLDWGAFGGLLKPSNIATDPQPQNSNVMFNMADKRQADLYMRYHDELVDQGMAYWWIDGDNAQMDGLNSQMWSNRVYYDYQQQHTGQRSLIFSRYGGPGSHRYPGFFTADCFANWRTLAWEVPYTLKSGNVLVPYVTHDIGGFINTLSDDFELYARWLQFGALSPLLRLHSAHENPQDGNARLPWVYGEAGTSLARTFFQLRYSLIPYLYTYCRAAYDTGLPLCRGLYLEYPDEPEAYRRFDEYLFGRELLVAPITAPGVDGVATRSIWFPPGEWVDWFTGESYAGGRTVDYSCPLERMPLFVRAGSIIPRQPEMAYTEQRAVDPLILDVYPGGPATTATFSLYEDDGLSLDYAQAGFRRTPVELAERDGAWELTIGAPAGQFTGMQSRQGYQVRWHVASQPATVTANGAAAPVEWDAAAHVATVALATTPAGEGSHEAIVVRVEG